MTHIVGGPYRFGRGSQAELEEVHPDLQKVLNEAIKLYDFTVLEGNRSIETQQRLYAQGRTAPGRVVTQIDGVKKKGKHNYAPARAVDIVPYPIDWSNRERFMHMAGIVLATAHFLGVRIRWGGDWNRDDDFEDGWDLPHFELLD